MNFLCLNCGGSSMKYEMLEMPAAKSLFKGSVDRLFTERATIRHTNADGETISRPLMGKTFADGIVWLTEKMRADGDVEFSMDVIVHKLAHGGEKYTQPVLLDDSVLADLQDLFELAPVHLPPAVAGIEVCRKLLPEVKQYAFFETSFHNTIPQYAYIYGLPFAWYEKYGVRKYGFHSASHQYVAEKCAEMLRRDVSELKIVSCHLGSGTSVAAIAGGKSVDISSGFTPQAGTMMSTRPGDFDPFVLPYVMKKTRLYIEDLQREMVENGGLLGISGVSGDLRDVRAAASAGNKRAQLAIEAFVYQIKKYVGAFAAVMNGIDALVFTGGIGENDAAVRSGVCDGLTYLGIVLDDNLNEAKERPILVQSTEAKVKIAVIETNEEYTTARRVYEMLTE